MFFVNYIFLVFFITAGSSV